MKILFVINNLTSGGVPSSLSCLYNQIKDSFDVNVFVLSKVGHENHSFINVVLPEIQFLRLYSAECRYLGKAEKLRAIGLKIIKNLMIKLGYDTDAFFYKRSVKILERKYDFDIVISFQDKITAKFCQYYKKPRLIAWIHCDYPRLMGRKKDEKVFSHFHDIVCVSSYTASQFKNYYNSLSDRVTFIYNIMDYERIVRMSDLEMDNSIFSNKVFTIVSIGRIQHLKRIYEIPKIAKGISSIGIDFEWYIIGSGARDEENVIIDEIKKMGVESYVYMLGNQPNPYPYLKNSDLLVSLSETEACPMIFNEARVLGIPIVSTDFGSSFEFIEDGVDGIIRPINQIGIEIQRLITDKTFYQYFKNNAKLHMIDNRRIINSFIRLIKNSHYE